MVTRIPTILAGLLVACCVARAQESAPVTIDASPSATELLRRAQEVAAENPGESARLLQEAVDRFAGKLVPWPPEQDRYRSAAAAAEELLRDLPAVRERWLKREAPTAERSVAEGLWVETVRDRAGTPAALQAMLLLAQRAMDEGRAFEARLWIDRALRHPALDEATRTRLQEAQSALRPASTPPPARVERPQEVQDWQPLWNRENPTAWLARRRTEVEADIAPRALDAQVEDGSALAADPRFDGDALLVADGATVQAIDRFSGSMRWRSLVGALTDRPSQSLGDLTVAVPVGDLVITLPGHALPDQRSGLARVVALDRVTGNRRWEVSLESLGRPEFEDLFPHGEPLAVGDLVLVQARKSNSRLESAAWVLAFEARTGRLRWAVPIGAAGGVRLAASRPLGSPRAVGDDVFVATSLGVVARLDGATGETRWLRRWPAPVREPRSASPAWQLPSPVADGRLVAWLAPDAATLAGFDPADGHTLWTVPVGVDTPIGAARTLLLGPDLLYAIGDDVVALDRADPRRIAWRLQERLPDRSGPIRGATTLGTLADGSMGLVVPLAERVLVIEPRTGQVLGQWSGRGGANPSLDTGQLAIAGASQISVLMPAADGERLLRERLASAPDDPRRGLALLELGRSWKRPSLMLDGAAAAAKALGNAVGPDADPVREEIVQRLLEPATTAVLGPDEASRMVAIAQSVAVSPSQRARVMLAGAARVLAQGSEASAAQVWRAIVAEPSLTRALVAVEPNHVVAAGTLARHALALQGDRDAMAWEATLRAGATPPPLPRVGSLQSSMRWIPGSLVPESASARASRPLDAVLLHQISGISLWRGTDLERAWRVPIEMRDPRVLAWTPRVVVWNPIDASDGTLLAIDPSDGRAAIRIDGAARILPARTSTPDEDRLERSRLVRLDACVSGPRVLLVRGDGAVAAIRMDGQGAPEWTASAPVRRVDAFDEDASHLALLGPRAPGDSEPTVALLRTADGQTAFEAPWPDALGRPLWVALVPGGVAIAGDEGTAMLDLDDRLPIRWMRLDPKLRGTEPELVIGGRLVIVDAQRHLASFALRDGGFTQDFLPLPEALSVTSVQPLQSGWLVHRLNGLTLHAEDGALRGEAFAASGRRHDQVAVAADGVYSAEMVQPDPARPVAAGSVLAVRHHAPDQGLRAIGVPKVLQTEGFRLQGADTVNGWLLLGGEDQTLAIAGNAGTAEPR